MLGVNIDAFYVAVFHNNNFKQICRKLFKPFALSVNIVGAFSALVSVKLIDYVANKNENKIPVAI